MKNVRKLFGIAAIAAGIALVGTMVKDLVKIKKITTDEDAASADEDTDPADEDNTPAEALDDTKPE